MDPWVAMPIVVLIAVLSGAISYGILKGSVTVEVTGLRRDLESLRLSVGGYVTRTEYESRHADMQRGMARMEQKLDRLLGGRE